MVSLTIGWRMVGEGGRQVKGYFINTGMRMQ